MSKKWRSLLLMLGLGGLILSLPANTHLTPLSVSQEELSVTSLYKIAKKITVKILSNHDIIGSGIIIKRDNNTYFIITNAHVLAAGNPPYFIQTDEEKLHAATLINQNFDQNDLGLLRMESTTKIYDVATLELSPSLREGDRVYAAGFPFLEFNKINPNSSVLFAFKQGEITQVLDKPLEGGYQIGFTTEIIKGMSGGALLNNQGKVIAINGRHAYPLWDAPDYYKDGSQVSMVEQKVISETSWGIPVQKIASLFHSGKVQ